MLPAIVLMIITAIIALIIVGLISVILQNYWFALLGIFVLVMAKFLPSTEIIRKKGFSITTNSLLAVVGVALILFSVFKMVFPSFFGSINSPIDFISFNNDVLIKFCLIIALLVLFLFFNKKLKVFK